MKKIFALVLALIMLAAVVPACADTLVFESGSPSATCTPEIFKLFFNAMEQASGYTFTWDEDAAAEGDYTVYTGQSSDGIMTIKIYAQGEGVVYTEAFGSISVDMSDMASVQQFGSWFGAAMSGMDMAYFISEVGSANITAEIQTQFTNELNAMVALLGADLDDEAKLRNGAVEVVTVLGYPCGMEIRGSSSGNLITLDMKVIVTGTDGVLAAK